MRHYRSRLTEDDALRECRPPWASLWHVWTLIIPRRGAGGEILWGRVWRRHDGQRWTYARLQALSVHELASVETANFDSRGGPPGLKISTPPPSDN